MEVLNMGREYSSDPDSISIFKADQSVHGFNKSTDIYTVSPQFGNTTLVYGTLGQTLNTKREYLAFHYRVIVTFIFSILILFTTCGNLATISAILVYKRLRTVSNMYLLSLAMADLVVGLPVMGFMLLYTITFNGSWIFGDAMCDIWTYIDFVSCTASLTNICAIAGDRFITLAQPLKSIRKRTKKRVLKVVTIAWLFPILFWLGTIVTLRYLNGWPDSRVCYLVWKPTSIALVSVALTVYLPLTIILVLFISILGLLKHHMGSMGNHMNQSPEGKSISRDQSDFLNAEKVGGISFNPRYSEANIRDTVNRDIPMTTIQCRASCPEIRSHFVSTAVGPDRNIPLCAHGEELYILGGKKFRTVGTSTSPERFGLVRTIATNTSPSLQRKDNLYKSTSGDCSSIGRSLLDAASILTSPSVVASAKSLDIRSDESDAETIKTISTCSSSTSRESRTDDSQLSLIKFGTKIRRQYAHLLRSERESTLEKARLRQQIRAAKILGVIMGFLLICWLPFAIVWPMRTICMECVSQRTYDICVWVNYINSAINPIIYCLYNPSFRRAFAKLFVKRRPCGCYCSRVPPDYW